MLRALTTVVAAVVLAACGSQSTPQPTRAAASTVDSAGWTQFRDSAHAFSIRVPPGWLRAPTSLTPGLTNPHEILTLSTHVARRGGEHCNHLPERAMRELGPGDVLLSLQERRGSGGFAERPRPYVLDAQPTDAGGCAERTDLREHFGGFRDRGRGVHVLVVMGPEVSDARRADAAAIVDSLEFEPAWSSRARGLRFQPPAGWHVYPHRLTAAVAPRDQLAFGSFPLRRAAAERNCTPRQAIRALPAGGAFVFAFEYRGLNRRQRLRFPAYAKLELRSQPVRAYECFGESRLFRFRLQGRVFQAHVYLGPRATPERRAEVEAALRSIAVTRR